MALLGALEASKDLDCNCCLESLCADNQLDTYYTKN